MEAAAAAVVVAAAGLPARDSALGEGGKQVVQRDPPQAMMTATAQIVGMARNPQTTAATKVHCTLFVVAVVVERVAPIVRRGSSACLLC